MDLKSIDNACSYIMDQIPDAMKRKYSLNISNNILENGTLFSFGSKFILFTNDLPSNRDDIYLLLKRGYVLEYTISWNLAIPILIFTDDIINLFEDDTIIEVTLVLTNGAHHVYKSHESVHALYKSDRLYKRSGKVIYEYSKSHQINVMITELVIKRTIESVLHGG